MSWTYNDDTTGSVIVPTGITGKLFDVNDVQRDPTNTANTTSATFTPTQDTDGSVTGTTNAFYVNVTFASTAVVGKWYVQTSFTHESVQKTQNLCFQVLAAGASVGGGITTGTPTTYIIAQEVANLLLIENFDKNTNPTEDAVEAIIIQVEGEFEEKTGTAFRPRLITDEVHDLRSWRGAYRETFPGWFTIPRPQGLMHQPIIPFDTTRGHKIEVYEGNDGTINAARPEGTWTEFVGSKTKGRTQDYWSDWQRGIVYVRKTFLIRQANLLRITYEYGKPIATTTAAHSSTATTITVSSTHRYETRGFFRIGKEYIYHTGKTDNSFTGCVRGKLGTQAASISSNAEVVEVPDGVRELITKRVAAKLLMSERYQALIPGGGEGTVSPSEQARQFNQEWELGLRRWQRWTLV